MIAQLNKQGGYGFGPLHEQVLQANNLKDLPEFKRVSVTKKPNEHILTPLHCACINPNGEILNKLLEVCPEYSFPDETLRKPIHYAAACEGPGPLKVLLEKGVDAREADPLGITPLMIAAIYGRAQNIKTLLEKEETSNIHAKNKESMQAIHLAAMNGHLDCIKELVKKGALINAPGRFRMTPLSIAAAYGHFECVEYILENKGRILAKDRMKRTALTMAVKNGNTKIVSYLLSKYELFIVLMNLLNSILIEVLISISQTLQTIIPFIMQQHMDGWIVLISLRKPELT